MPSQQLRGFSPRRYLVDDTAVDRRPPLGVVGESFVFPLPSLSLKVIEKHVGFTRKLSETDGAWAICRYIEAIETSDPRRAGCDHGGDPRLQRGTRRRDPGGNGVGPKGECMGGYNSALRGCGGACGEYPLIPNNAGP